MFLFLFACTVKQREKILQEKKHEMYSKKMKKQSQLIGGTIALPDF